MENDQKPRELRASHEFTKESAVLSQPDVIKSNTDNIAGTVFAVLIALCNFLIPFIYAIPGGYSAIALVAIIIFALPVIPFIINLIFTYCYVGRIHRSMKSKVTIALWCTLWPSLLGQLVGALIHLAVHGAMIRECLDSCSEYPLYRGVAINFALSQICLLGGYIGIALGKHRAKKIHTATGTDRFNDQELIRNLLHHLKFCAKIYPI